MSLMTRDTETEVIVAETKVPYDEFAAALDARLASYARVNTAKNNVAKALAELRAGR